MAEIKESCYCNFDALKSALLRVVKRGKKVIISRLGGVESELKKRMQIDRARKGNTIHNNCAFDILQFSARRQ